MSNQIAMIPQMIINAIMQGKEESDSMDWLEDKVEFGTCHETQFAHIIGKYLNQRNWYTELEVKITDNKRHDLYARNKKNTKIEVLIEIKEFHLCEGAGCQKGIKNTIRNCLKDVDKLKKENKISHKYFVLIAYGNPVSEKNDQASRLYKYLRAPEPDNIKKNSFLVAINRLSRTYAILRSKKDKYEYTINIWQIK